LNEHWACLVEKLERSGLVRGYPFQPLGYSYFLRANTPKPRLGNAFQVGDALGLATRDMGEGIGAAIHSGLLAADALIHHQAYKVNTIPRYSWPSRLDLRRSVG